MYTGLAGLFGCRGPSPRWAAVRWQPFIDTTADTQDHEPLEENDDRYPFLLLNAPVPPPPGGGGLLLRTLMGVGV